MENNKEATIQKLCTGNGGTARIEYQGNSAMWWSVNPKSSLPYSFLGGIEIYDGSKLVTTVPISGMGQAGRDITNSTRVPYSGTKRYKAVLTGYATDSNANRFFVVPFCDLTYVSKYE